MKDAEKSTFINEIVDIKIQLHPEIRNLSYLFFMPLDGKINSCPGDILVLGGGLGAFISVMWKGIGECFHLL